MLLVGFSIIFMLVPDLGGGFSQVVERIYQTDPIKLTVPTWTGTNKWLSYVFLLGCGAAIYPQAIQRLYASRSVKVLKVSFLDGFYAANNYPHCPGMWINGYCFARNKGSQIGSSLRLVLALIMAESDLGYWLVVAVFAAALVP